MVIKAWKKKKKDHNAINHHAEALIKYLCVHEGIWWKQTRQIMCKCEQLENVMMKAKTWRRCGWNPEALAWPSVWSQQNLMADVPGCPVSQYVQLSGMEFIPAYCQIWCYIKTGSVLNILCISTENIRDIFVLCFWSFLLVFNCFYFNKLARIFFLIWMRWNFLFCFVSIWFWLLILKRTWVCLDCFTGKKVLWWWQ